MTDASDRKCDPVEEIMAWVVKKGLIVWGLKGLKDVRDQKVESAERAEDSVRAQWGGLTLAKGFSDFVPPRWHRLGGIFPKKEITVGSDNIVAFCWQPVCNAALSSLFLQCAVCCYCHYSCNDSLPANGAGLIFTQTLLSFSDNEDDLFLNLHRETTIWGCSIYS